jgi:hypothetical protein
MYLLSSLLNSLELSYRCLKPIRHCHCHCPLPLPLPSPLLSSPLFLPRRLSLIDLITLAVRAAVLESRCECPLELHLRHLRAFVPFALPPLSSSMRRFSTPIRAWTTVLTSLSLSLSSLLGSVLRFELTRIHLRTAHFSHTFVTHLGPLGGRAHTAKLVTHLSQLGALLVKFVSVGQSAQITDLKPSIHNAQDNT